MSPRLVVKLLIKQRVVHEPTVNNIKVTPSSVGLISPFLFRDNAESAGLGPGQPYKSDPTKVGP